MIYRGFEVWQETTGKWFWGSSKGDVPALGPFDSDERAMNDIDDFKRRQREAAEQ